MRSTKFRIGVACAATGVLALMLTAWATGAGTATQVGTGKASATKSVCGKGTGKKATGSPIKLGGIDMLIPGVDFTTIGKVAKAYFDCVNDNGGINGRPIKYTLYNEQLNPAQEAALARKLIESDKVVGVVGNTSFAECGTNWKYYKSKGFIVIGAGVQAECYSTPSFAEVNMGPRYSNVGAAQALVKAGIKKLAIASPDTISAYADGGPALVATEGRHPVQDLPDPPAGHGRDLAADPDVPVRRRRRRHPDRLHARHGSGVHEGRRGAGHRRQGEVGLVDPDREHVHGRPVLAEFDGHLWINSEFSNVDPKVGPDTALMFQILKKYAPSDRSAGVRTDGLHGRQCSRRTRC